jgi:serine O-acetyltransferase
MWLLYPFFIIIKVLFLKISIRLGFSIPINTLGKGVHLPHYGTIVVNERSFIGNYSVINVGVDIGRHPTSKGKVPRIGSCVYLGPGVKVFGYVNIDDNAVVGANCVVTK